MHIEVSFAWIGPPRHEKFPLADAALTQRLGVPTHALAIVLDALQGAGLPVQTEGYARAYLPARDPDTITVRQLLETVRSAGEDRFPGPAALPAPVHIELLLEMIERAAGERIGSLTLRELVAASPVEGVQAEPRQACTASLISPALPRA